MIVNECIATIFHNDADEIVSVALRTEYENFSLTYDRYSLLQIALKFNKVTTKWNNSVTEIIQRATLKPAIERVNAQMESIDEAIMIQQTMVFKALLSDNANVCNGVMLTIKHADIQFD